MPATQSWPCFQSNNSRAGLFYVPGELDAAQEPSRQRSVAVLRLPVLLLYTRLLHVAGHLFIEKGNDLPIRGARELTGGKVASLGQVGSQLFLHKNYQFEPLKNICLY